ncbi:MAG: hypothetical protein U9R57_06445 [Thermodesulfobacteriota bacterium]|nr:hypothetical protein [Thermodesulfobacteriota bacterium]
MKTILSFIIAVMGLPCVAYSGEIYGTIRIDGHLAKEIAVKITCQTGTEYNGFTDQYGGYSIYVRESGPCTLIVKDKNNHTLTKRLRSFSKPVMVNF